MPLIQCPDCHKQASDLAVSCPHCGYPFAKEKQRVQQEEIDRRTSLLRRQQQEKADKEARENRVRVEAENALRQQTALAAQEKAKQVRAEIEVRLRRENLCLDCEMPLLNAEISAGREKHVGGCSSGLCDKCHRPFGRYKWDAPPNQPGSLFAGTSGKRGAVCFKCYRGRVCCIGQRTRTTPTEQEFHNKIVALGLKESGDVPAGACAKCGQPLGVVDTMLGRQECKGNCPRT